MREKKKPAYTQILESLEELFAQYSIQKLTTKQIADACNISSRTFYNYFYDKYDAAAAMFLHIVEPYIYDNLSTWYNHGCDLNDHSVAIIHNCILAQDNTAIIETYKKVEYEKLKMHILPEAYKDPKTAQQIECDIIFFVNGIKGLIRDLFLQSSFISPLFTAGDFFLDADMSYTFFPETLRKYFSDTVVAEPSKEFLELFEKRHFI